jgi:hypothetical protein
MRKVLVMCEKERVIAVPMLVEEEMGSCTLVEL